MSTICLHLFSSKRYLPRVSSSNASEATNGETYAVSGIILHISRVGLKQATAHIDIDNKCRMVDGGIRHPAPTPAPGCNAGKLISLAPQIVAGHPSSLLHCSLDINYPCISANSKRAHRGLSLRTSRAL